MSNKTQLQTNTATINDYITRINAAKNIAASLPEAGSSEDLTAELTEQANLIAQQQTLISNLETALENKAGGSGGGSVEMCWGYFTTSYGPCLACFYQDENGNLQHLSTSSNNCDNIEVTAPKNSYVYYICTYVEDVYADKAEIVSISPLAFDEVFGEHKVVKVKILDDYFVINI